MPESQPFKITATREETEAFNNQLNYIIKDLYSWIDNIQGFGANQFQPQDIDTGDVSDHDHTSSSEGGDYPWADFVAADVTYLQALVADITVTDLLDKSANETITGTWTFDDLIVTEILNLLERSADPTEPGEGEAVIWMSDSTGKGDDGDILAASQAGGNTTYTIIHVNATGVAW